MYHTTGLTKAQIAKLCARIEERGIKPGMRPWPPILGLRNALTVTLTYLRRNRVQEEIAEDYGVSQPTISRAISAITPLLVQVLVEYVPTADDLDGSRQFIVDGTLLPCWSWGAHPDLYSGKHKTTGMRSWSPAPSKDVFHGFRTRCQGNAMTTTASANHRSSRMLTRLTGSATRVSSETG